MGARILAAVIALLACGGWWLWRGSASQGPAAARTPSSAAGTAPLELAVERAATSDAERAAVVEPSGLEAASNLPSPRAKRRLRLVDDVTGEAVPHFEVERQPDGGVHHSDEHGLLEFDDSRSLPLTLALLENTKGEPDSLPTGREVVAAIATSVVAPDEAAPGEVQELSIPVGPTYRLVLAPPPGFALEELLLNLHPADPNQRFDHATARIRPGVAPWVRFRATARVMHGGPRWQLEASTPDGLWFGSALVPSNVGVHPDPVQIPFEPRAQLSGLVRDEAGSVLAGGHVRIERDGASFSNASNRPLLGRVEESGEYVIPCAVSGEYTASFQRDTFLPFKTRVTLTAGLASRLDITLQRPPPAEVGRVEARIESASGRHDRAMYPYLRPAGSKTGSRGAKVTWSDEAGRRVGKFAFDAVPHGDYDIGLQGAGFFRLEAREQRVRPGDPEVVFRVQDDLWTLLPFEVEAVDPAGAALPKFLAQLSVEATWGVVLDRVNGADGRARFEAAPVGERARFKVSCDGRQPVWGELELEATNRTLKVVLEPGWGIEVVVKNSSGAPLGGAAVFFDDQRAGETNALGELFVALPKAPERARFEYLDWKPKPDSNLDESGRFRNFSPWLTVTLAPPK